MFIVEILENVGKQQKENDSLVIFSLRDKCSQHLLNAIYIYDVTTACLALC